MVDKSMINIMLQRLNTASFPNPSRGVVAICSDQLYTVC